MATRNYPAVVADDFATVLVKDLLGAAAAGKPLLLLVGSERDQCLLANMALRQKNDMCELAEGFWRIATGRAIGLYIGRCPADGSCSVGPGRGSCKELTARVAVAFDAD